MTNPIGPALRMAERLGARILGAQVVEKITEAREAGTDRYGYRVTGKMEEVTVLDGLRTADPNGDGSVSLTEMGRMLAENPALLDVMIDAEALRAEPRKGAYQAFMKAEAAGLAREEVMNALKVSLDALIPAAPAAVVASIAAPAAPADGQPADTGTAENTPAESV